MVRITDADSSDFVRNVPQEPQRPEGTPKAPFPGVGGTTGKRSPTLSSTGNAGSDQEKYAALPDGLKKMLSFEEYSALPQKVREGSVGDIFESVMISKGADTGGFVLPSGTIRELSEGGYKNSGILEKIKSGEITSAGDLFIAMNTYRTDNPELF